MGSFSVSLTGSPQEPLARAVAIDGLAHQIDRLHDFEHPHIEPVPTVAQHGRMGHRGIVVVVGIMAVLFDDHFEGVAVVHLGVAFFAVAAQIVIDAAAAQHRAGAAVVDGHLAGHDADAGGAADENRVGRQQRVILGDDRLELIEERFAPLQPAGRQIGVAPPTVR